MAHDGLVRVVAYLEPVLAERLVAEAGREGRSVSREVARRLAVSLGELPVPPRVTSEPPPAAMQAHPDPHPYTTPLPKPLREAVSASKGAVTVGAKVGTCPREHYHRRGQYCKTCGRSY